MGDCPDTEVLHDVLELMCNLLHPHEASQRPLLACLADLGGIQLFMSLVQREQQSIRVLGLRIVAAFVPFPAGSLSSPPGTTGLDMSLHISLLARCCYSACGPCHTSYGWCYAIYTNVSLMVIVHGKCGCKILPCHRIGCNGAWSVGDMQGDPVTLQVQMAVQCGRPWLMRCSCFR